MFIFVWDCIFVAANSDDDERLQYFLKKVISQEIPWKQLNVDVFPQISLIL